MRDRTRSYSYAKETNSAKSFEGYEVLESYVRLRSETKKKQKIKIIYFSDKVALSLEKMQMAAIRKRWHLSEFWKLLMHNETQKDYVSFELLIVTYQCNLCWFSSRISGLSICNCRKSKYAFAVCSINSVTATLSDGLLWFYPLR